MRVSVVGCGSWGTAFARLLVLQGHEPTLICRDAAQAEAIVRHRRNPRHLFDVELPEGLGAMRRRRRSVHADLVAIAVPSRAFAAVAAEVLPRAGAGPAFLSMTKGLDPASGRRLSRDPRRARAGPTGWRCSRDRTMPRRWPATSRQRRWWRARTRSWRGCLQRGAVGPGRCASTRPSDVAGRRAVRRVQERDRDRRRAFRMGSATATTPRRRSSPGGWPRCLAPGRGVRGAAAHLHGYGWAWVIWWRRAPPVDSRNRKAGEMLATGVPTQLDRARSSARSPRG